MAVIFCFTSTGNSLYTAKKLAEKIDGKVIPMNIEAIQSKEKVIGFVFPVYYWGLPRIVERFVKQLEITGKDTYVFAVTPCGGPIFGMLGSLKKILQAKGVRLHYGTKLVSVSNYLPEYEAKDSDKLRRKVDDKIIKIADAVNRRECNRIQRFTILNKTIYRMFPDEYSDRHFIVMPTCTGCKTCQKVCPVSNIKIEGKKPEFQHKCEHCLACVHNCPACAIDWKQETQGKNRYRNANISLGDLISFNKS